jgi:hypothetical protein
LDEADILENPRYLNYMIAEILKNINTQLIILNENLSKQK